MTMLSELIGRVITPEMKGRNQPTTLIMDAPIRPNTEKPHGQYEADVFNYLLAEKKRLGIKAVMKFTARLVDGAVELFDGRRLTVEIKYRMNWEKACQAEWQFRSIVKRTDLRPFPVAGGIVVFEEFSGDWNRQAASRLLANGWSHWYHGHADVEGCRVDLLRFRNGELVGFPVADAIVEKFKRLPEEQAGRVLAALAERGG